MVTFRQISILGCIVLLAACSADKGRYPSLATRDVELREDLFNVPGSAAPAPVAPSAELAARLDELAAEIDRSHGKFLAVLPNARAAVNRAVGSPKGSTAWADAMVRISELDAARSLGMSSLARLDELRVEAATNGGAIEAIEAVWVRADATLSEENTVLSRLTGRIPQ